MARKVYSHSFAGGQVSPLMLGHIEDEGYRTGFADGLNMIVLPTGAVTKRPPFEFVHEAKPGQSAYRMFPFRYGDGDGYAMEWGPNHTRFHRNGEPVRYATPVPIASVDLSADEFTSADPHGFAVNDAVRITHKGTSIPGNLATGSTYYVRTVPTDSTFTLSASAGPGALLDLTTNSTIDETSFWKQSELPREYVSSKNVAGVNAGADTVNIVAHQLVAGDAINLTASLVFTADSTTDTCTSVAHGLAVNDPFTATSSGTLPAPLVAGTTYYVRAVPTADTFTLNTAPGAITGIDLTTNGTGTHTLSPAIILRSTPTITTGETLYVSVTDVDNIKLYTTQAAALAASGAINITGAGAGVSRMNFIYAHGEVVWGGSLTLSGSTSSRAFWAIEPTTALPTVSGWHQMPADGVYELYHTLGAAALAALNYDQSFDAWTLCKPQSAAYTLNRNFTDIPSGSSATASVLRWTFEPVDVSPPIDAPTWDAPTIDYGDYLAITSWGTGGTSQIATVDSSGTSPGPASVIPGDTVYMEKTLGAGDAITGIAGTAGFFTVTNVGQFGGTGAAQDLRFRAINGGGIVANSSGATQTGFLRIVGSSARLSETYVVTAMDENGDESVPSEELEIVNILSNSGASNVLAWDEPEGAVRYRVYKKLDGAFWLIGETEDLTFTDDGIESDESAGDPNPPTLDDTLQTEYPRAVANFQQRPWFAGTTEHPRTAWGGKTGTVSTMTHHERIPLATDRIRFNVAVTERTLIRHIVPASHLWLLTSSAEIRVTGTNTDVLAPGQIDARPLSQIGSTGVRPIVANSNILFVGSKDQHVYELPAQVNQVVEPADLSVRAADLFDGYVPQQSAQQRAPVPIEWYPRDDGTLLGMTYMPAQNIRGWHQHRAAGTDARILSVCMGPDSDGEHLYAAVERTIGGETVVYVERMGLIGKPASMAACKYLDSCVSYEGDATRTIDDLEHLEGEVVYAVADGVVRGPFTVADAAIQLPKAASPVHVGLLYAPLFKLLPPAVMVDGYGKGRELNVDEVSVRVQDSCTFKVKRYADTDAEFGVTRRAWPADGLVDTAMRSKDVLAPTEGGWDRNAQIIITQDVPLPLTIVSMAVAVNVGGPD